MARLRFFLAPLFPKQYITKRQAECLVFLLQNPQATYRGLGLHLGISRRTVELHINFLREAFDCHSRQELLAKAQQLPWCEWVPLLYPLLCNEKD